MWDQKGILLFPNTDNSDLLGRVWCLALFEIMADRTNSKRFNKASIRITGMTCATCAAAIERGLSDTRGVEQAHINFASEKASIEYDPT